MVVHISRRPQRGHSASELTVAEDEITCQQFVELVTDYMEGAVAERTLSQVEEHLVMCDWCVTYLEQTEAIINALAALGTEPHAGHLRESTLSLLRAKRGGLR
jgi:hypothetical protein